MAEALSWRAGCLGLALGVALAGAAPCRAGWVAFNDHVPGAIGTQTSPNATTYNALTGTGGHLKNVDTGATLPAAVIIQSTGDPTSGSFGAQPSAGSDAAITFSGYVYFAGTEPTIQTTVRDALYYTFTNLAPSRLYGFAGTTVRGGSYPLRWSLYEILGTADGNTAFAGAHTRGINIVTNGAPFSPSAVAPNGVAINSGDNREGYVARWVNIRPAPNGTFTVRCLQYTGPIPAGGNASASGNGYAINGFRLEELGFGPSANIASPADRQVFELPATVEVRAGASEAGGTVTGLVVYADGAPLRRAAGSACEFAWTNASAGTHTLVAVATDAQGLCGTSLPVRVEMRLPPLTVESVAPVPGIPVAALTSVTVRFNRPVTGVDAADLCVNATPCAGVAGAGSGPYAFTFAQPPAGTAVLGWAAGHGIRDAAGEPFAGAPWAIDVTSAPAGIGPPYRLRMVAPGGYMPDAPFLVRVELLRPDGTRAREVWDADAALSSSNPRVTLPEGAVHLYNGIGSALLALTNREDFALAATLGDLQTNRLVVSRAAEPVKVVSGALPTGGTTWNGVIHITGDVTLPAAGTLTIEPDTLVLVDGVSGGTGITITVQGTLNSLGTEERPVAFTVASSALNWGRLRHTTRSRSLFRHTLISKGGRSTPTGHTASGPMITLTACTNRYEDCSLTDVTRGSNTIGKVMMTGGGCDLVLTNCLVTRALTGPEINLTGLRCDRSSFVDLLGSPLAPQGTNDNDGIYIHDQGARTVVLRDCLLARCEDDGIDTLGSGVEVRDTLIRNCDNPREDSKGISIYGGEVTVRHCLLADNTCGISGKDGESVWIRVESSTVIANEQYALGVLNKTGTMFPRVDVRATNCIFLTLATNVPAVFTSYDPADMRLDYCALGSAWSGAANCVFGDPRLVSPAAHDYRLQAVSPCIDGGDPASPPDPDGSRADIGCFAYEAAPPLALQPSAIVGGFQFLLRLTPGRDYVVQRSADLINWEDWLTAHCTNEPMSVVDEEVVSHGVRFYRARLGGAASP